MGIAERKERHRADREKRIVEAARAIAEAEGWAAVTIRRLADEIEYSQPVIYAHFESRDAIIAAVAIDGFQDVTKVLLEAVAGAKSSKERLQKAGLTYLSFARAQPAIYEAMFTLQTGLYFARSETKPQLKAAFEALSAAVPSGNSDLELVTEAFCASLHGLAELERSGRIRKSTRVARLSLIVDGVLAG